MTVWLNGELKTVAEAHLRPDDRGFALGDGLFETLAVRDGVALRVDAHLDRLRLGCACLALPLPYADDALRRALDAVVEATAGWWGVLRLTVSRGPGPRGVAPPDTPAPTVLVTFTAGVPASPSPVTLIVATGTRRNEHSPLARVKSLNYLDAVLARQEAARRGAGDALLLNTAGAVAEATAANLFAVIDGRVVTPSVGDGALPGLMRAAVLAALSGTERTLAPDDLRAASELFLTNVTGIRPAVRLDGLPVGDGRPGPLWASLGGLILGHERP